MSRIEPTPGWGKRIGLIRNRLGFSRAAFAKRFDVAPTSVRGWEESDSGTSISTLKRGFTAIGVMELDRLLSWLADGSGNPPAWLGDLNLDPTATPKELKRDLAEAGLSGLYEAFQSHSTSRDRDGTGPRPSLGRATLAETSGQTDVTPNKAPWPKGLFPAQPATPESQSIRILEAFERGEIRKEEVLTTLHTLWKAGLAGFVAAFVLFLPKPALALEAQGNHLFQRARRAKRA